MIQHRAALVAASRASGVGCERISTQRGASETSSLCRKTLCTRVGDQLLPLLWFPLGRHKTTVSAFQGASVYKNNTPGIMSRYVGTDSG